MPVSTFTIVIMALATAALLLSMIVTRIRPRFIVMPSAALERAAKAAAEARLLNNGQSCIAAKRFILDESIAGEFEHRFVQHMESVKIGDPLNDETQLARQVLDDLDQQVRQSVQMGAS